MVWHPWAQLCPPAVTPSLLLCPLSGACLNPDSLPGRHPLLSFPASPLPQPSTSPVALQKPPFPCLTGSPQPLWSLLSVTGVALTAGKAELGPLLSHFLAVPPQAPLPAPGRLGFCVRKEESGTLTLGPWPGLPGALSVEHLAWRPARGKVEVLGSHPLLWAPLWALLWVCLPRPLPSTRRGFDTICPGHREPGGLRLEVIATGLTPRPLPTAPARAPTMSQTAGVYWGCRRDKIALLALRSWPRSKVHRVIADLDGGCAGTEQRTVTEGTRGRGKTSEGGVSENSPQGAINRLWCRAVQRRKQTEDSNFSIDGCH